MLLTASSTTLTFCWLSGQPCLSVTMPAKSGQYDHIAVVISEVGDQLPVRLYANGAELTDPMDRKPFLKNAWCIPEASSYEKPRSYSSADTFKQGDCKHAVLGAGMPPMEPLRLGGAAASDKVGPQAGAGTSAADHIRFYNYPLSASQVSADATCAADDSCKNKLNLGSADTTPPYLDYLRKPVAADVVIDPNGLLELQAGIDEPLEYAYRSARTSSPLNLLCLFLTL